MGFRYRRFRCCHETAIEFKVLLGNEKLMFHSYLVEGMSGGKQLSKRARAGMPSGSGQPYSITSSARPSNVAGISMPSALAAPTSLVVPFSFALPADTDSAAGHACARIGRPASAASSLPAAPREAEPVTNQRLVDLSRLTTPNLPQYGHFIPACNGINQVRDATYKCSVQSNGTGPRAGSCRARSAA